MQSTPKSLRLQIAIFGRTNVGKSSVLNMLAGQDVAITSPSAGTTTDVVEKSMELLPVGPVVFLDTAGLNDTSELGDLRAKKAYQVFNRADVAILVIEPSIWGKWEEEVADRAKTKNIPLIVLINKTDLALPSDAILSILKKNKLQPVVCSAVSQTGREAAVNTLKEQLLQIVKATAVKPQPLLSDLIQPGQTAILIIPIDKEAPKGRIILPQVQAMRALLDHGCVAIAAREHEYSAALTALKVPPALVVCDSQVVDLMVKHTPPAVPCTTFSILFARFKGDLSHYVKGASAIKTLRPGDHIAILEACSHHALEDDIGRVKLPKWLKEKAGGELKIDVFSGRDLPPEPADYKLIIQCGGCMLNRTEILNRMEIVKNAGTPITNYGLAIAECKNVLSRVLEPFINLQ